MNTSGVPSSQEPTTTFNDKNEIRWSTGVRRHMMDVFRADPFTTMDLLLLTLLSLLSVVRLPLMALSAQTGINFVSCRWRSANTLTHSNSPEFVGPRKRGRKKRARIPSTSFVPFRATGPQEMYAYEFLVDVDPPYWSMEVSYVENNGWSDRPSDRKSVV